MPEEMDPRTNGRSGIGYPEIIGCVARGVVDTLVRCVVQIYDGTRIARCNLSLGACGAEKESGDDESREQMHRALRWSPQRSDVRQWLQSYSYSFFFYEAPESSEG